MPKFLTPLVLPVKTTAPTVPTPVEGAMYYNSTNDTVYAYDGVMWDPVGGIINHARTFMLMGG
jgi:hypothetical protein